MKLEEGSCEVRSLQSFHVFFLILFYLMGAVGGGGRVFFHGGPSVRIPPTALCRVFEKRTSSSLLSTG